LVDLNFVPSRQFTGEQVSIQFIDGTKRTFPLVRVKVDTPYFVGNLEALALNHPIIPLVIGNIPGVKDHEADKMPEIQPQQNVAMVQTRAQKAKEDTMVSLKTGKIVLSKVTKECLQKEQEEDKSISALFRKVGAES
jgi:hypothetical protein